MIEFSERESRLFDLRFGRATIDSDFNQWNEVRKAASDLDLDYLRLKIVNPDSDFLAGFSEMAPKADLTGIIRLYKIIITAEQAQYNAPVAEFRKASIGDKQLLKELLMETYTDVPFGYYQYPRLTKSFPIDIQMENIGSYIADHFSGTEEGKEAYIGYIDGKPVECFASDFRDGLTATTLYAGIVREYRDNDLFKDMIRFFKNLCFKKGMTKAICGARLENLSSQYAMEKEGSICYGYEWVYMIGFDK
ncbi:MAG: hypothetical protein JWO03_3033 [Bacteroidetes bacterium]|nr:hypothetical protein [Bacteroidota bacterium]